MLKIAGMEW